MKKSQNILHLFHGRWNTKDPLMKQGFDGQSILCDRLVFTHGGIRIFSGEEEPFQLNIVDGMVETIVDQKKAYFSDFYFGKTVDIQGRRLYDGVPLTQFVTSQSLPKNRSTNRMGFSESLANKSREWFTATGSMDIESLLEEISVAEVSELEDGTSGLDGWYAVINESGVFAYFSDESQALKCRLDYINQILNTI